MVLASEHGRSMPAADNSPSAGKARIFSKGWKPGFLFWFLVILALWLPWVVLCMPGSNSTDTLAQLSQFMGHRPYSNHHPVVSTIIFGAVYSVGMFFDGNQGGHVALLLFQYVAMAAMVALAARWLAKGGLDARIVAAITLFIGICPVFPMFVQWPVKNTIAAGVMYLFAVQLAVLLLDSEHGESPHSFCSWWALALTGIFCCLLRNDGAYIVLPTLLVALLVLVRKPDYRRAVLGSFGGILAVYLVWMMAVIPGLGIATSNPREMLSLPIQQLAYTIKNDPKYFEGELGKEIESLLIEDRNLKTIADKYSVKKSDPVKKQFRFDNRDEVSQFLGIWARVGSDHLDQYREALALHTRGYWNPFMSKGKYCEVNTVGKLYTVAARGTPNEDHFDGVYEVHPGGKSLCKGLINFMWSVPGLALLVNPAFYVWVCVLAGLGLLIRRRPTAVLLVLCVCIIGICCLSPLTGGLRYAFPLCFLAPLMLGFLASRKPAVDVASRARHAAGAAPTRDEERETAEQGDEDDR